MEVIDWGTEGWFILYCRLIVYFKKYSLQTNSVLSSLYPKVKREWRYLLILSCIFFQELNGLHLFSKNLFSMFLSDLQNRLRGSGHGIAAARMDAKLNVAGWISEQMGGIRLECFLFGFILFPVSFFHNLLYSFHSKNLGFQYMW